MGYIIAKLCDGKEVQMYSKFNIGDYVKVVDTRHQYSLYDTAFKFFWGDTHRCVGEYENDIAYQAAMARMPQRWKVINMAVHGVSPDIILYHIRSEDGKNCVVSEGAIKLMDFHHRNREPIGKLMIYQLPLDGNVMKHKWTEKLYKIIKTMGKIKQIVTHFTDNDMYTFTCQYYILHTYPRAEVRYAFFDRNHTRYPQGFGELLQEQINGMKDVTITEEEIAFMKRKIYFLPDWYYNFLRGFRFNPSEVHILQDQAGYLSIVIEGKWYSTIMWEMPILSTISELLHTINGDVEKVNRKAEYNRAYEKGVKAFTNGILLSDMGTRRRFSFQNQQDVVEALIKADDDCKGYSGKLVGTSNVWFAKEFDLTPIGTMSHQLCSFEECVSGVFECNHQLMKKWSDVYSGDLGIFLPDCFGSKVFLSNFSKDMAKMFDGIRIDSGDEHEETEKMIEKYRSLGIDASTKSIVYSNALSIDKAIDLHKWLGGRMKDSYGIGTHLMADVTNTATNEKYPYSNIVIKLVGMRITESREWHDCVKLSNDKGKTLGDKTKCEYLVKQIGE